MGSPVIVSSFGFARKDENMNVLHGMYLVLGATLSWVRSAARKKEDMRAWLSQKPAQVLHSH